MRDSEELKRHRVFRAMETIARYMDRYCIDGLIGLIPGSGDIVSALCVVPFAWFSLFVVRSVPLTLAVTNNALRDVLIGMVPFFVGDVLDFFYRSNTRNLRMIVSFVNGDEKVVSEVNRKAVQTAVGIAVLTALIVLMVVLIVRIGGWVAGMI